jgi:precorrin-6B methylase 2
MTTDIQTLLQLSGKRKYELNSIIGDNFKWTVSKGPFQGLKLHTGDLYLSNKFLGIYEECLHPWIELAISYLPEKIVNVGCGDGYYGLGLGIRCPNSHVVCIDTDPNCIEQVKKNAHVNEFTRYSGLTESTPEIIETAIQGSRSFVMMDCEGAELQLLDPSTVPSLRNAYILVELHPFKVPDIDTILLSRFSDTHTIDRIQQTTPSIHIPVLKNMADWDKMLVMTESRPCSMEWFFLTPKNYRPTNI